MFFFVFTQKLALEARVYIFPQKLLSFPSQSLSTSSSHLRNNNEEYTSMPRRFEDIPSNVVRLKDGLAIDINPVGSLSAGSHTPTAPVHGRPEREYFPIVVNEHHPVHFPP